MTNLKTTLFALFSIFLTGNLSAQINPTENFQNFSTADGLISDDITDVYIQDNSNIWIATSAGLSHFNGAAFTNYTTANSNLINNNLSELEYSQNKIWMVSDSGVSSFNGTSFTNYTTSNGLLNNDIKGITTTSNDTLWMTSMSGTSKFDGTTFTHYTSQTGRDIETDSMNRVYVMRSTVANNFPFVHLYEAGAWTMPAQSGINFGINGAKLVKTASNSLYVTGNASNPMVFIKINYPLNCEKQNVYYQNSPYNINSISAQINPRQFEEYNGLRWMGGGTQVAFYYVSNDSNYVDQYVSNSVAVSSCIKAKGNLLAIGSDKGLYLTAPTKKSSKNELELSINSIRTSVNQTDPLFSDVLRNRSNFEFPKDSNSHGIYSANFIVAAKKASQNNFTVYPTNGFSQSYTPGPRSSSAGTSNNYMVSVLRQDIDNHIANYNQTGYTMPEGIRDWPASGDSSLGIASDLAPFFDANNNGCYDPQNGDYPIIKGDQAIYWINHPIDQNLELEYHWMMYGFNKPTDKSLHQSIFVQYTMINRSSLTYDSVKVGLFIDGDLGNPADDYIGTDSLNNIIYFYNGDSFDEAVSGRSGYENTAPALGVKFLSDSLANSIYFNWGSGNNGTPVNAQDWLNYMNSRWKNGQAITYGGDGYQTATTTNPTTHMFTGDPVSLNGWSEENPGGGLNRNSSGDRRMFGSMPYFSLAPQARKTIEIAVGYGRTSNTSSVIGKNIAEMQTILNQAGNFWDTLSTPPANFATNDTCDVLTSISEILEKEERFSIYPVPSTGELTVQSEEKMTQLEIYDTKGTLIERLAPTALNIKLNLQGLPEGTYLIRIQSQNKNWETRKIILTD